MHARVLIICLKCAQLNELSNSILHGMIICLDVATLCELHELFAYPKYNNTYQFRSEQKEVLISFSNLLSYGSDLTQRRLHRVSHQHRYYYLAEASTLF